MSCVDYLSSFIAKANLKLAEEGKPLTPLTQEGLEFSPVSGPIATGIALAPLRLHLSKTAMEQVAEQRRAFCSRPSTA